MRKRTFSTNLLTRVSTLKISKDLHDVGNDDSRVRVLVGLLANVCYGPNASSVWYELKRYGYDAAKLKRLAQQLDSLAKELRLLNDNPILTPIRLLKSVSEPSRPPEYDRRKICEFVEQLPWTLQFYA